MSDIDKRLLDLLRQLPPSKLAEVECYIEFLVTKERRQQAIRKFLAVAPAIEAAGFPPLTEEEIAEEIASARRARRKETDRS